MSGSSRRAGGKPLPRARRNPPIGRKTAAIAGSCLAAAAALTVVVVLAVGSPAPKPANIVPISRAQTYTAYSACLLTGSSGLTDPVAEATWAGMQAASDTTHAQVSYLPMQGAATAGNAGVYINTLALRGCSIVIAAGTLPTQGALARAAAWPHLPIVAITPPATKPGAETTHPAAPNLTVLTDSSARALQARVEDLLTAASGGATAPTP